MDTKHEIPYLTQDELLSLVEDIETTPGELVQAPAHLEEQILAKLPVGERLPEPAARDAAAAPKEPERAAGDKKIVSLADARIRKKQELRRYSLRVMVSAAASIMLMLVLPFVSQNVTLPASQEAQQEAGEELSGLEQRRAEREQQAAERERESYEEQKAKYEKAQEARASERARQREAYYDRETTETSEDAGGESLLDQIGNRAGDVFSFFRGLGK